LGKKKRKEIGVSCFKACLFGEKEEKEREEGGGREKIPIIPLFGWKAMCVCVCVCVCVCGRGRRGGGGRWDSKLGGGRRERENLYHSSVWLEGNVGVGVGVGVGRERENPYHSFVWLEDNVGGGGVGVGGLMGLKIFYMDSLFFSILKSGEKLHKKKKKKKRSRSRSMEKNLN
jgi:hypothetical protein